MDKQIQEGNKAIAEFMGENTKISSRGSLIIVYDKPEDDVDCPFAYPLYNTSWDWLMPVVEKIGVVTIEEMISEDLDIYTATIFSDIKFTYECVIQFINWYNTNK